MGKLRNKPDFQYLEPVIGWIGILCSASMVSYVTFCFFVEYGFDINNHLAETFSILFCWSILIPIAKKYLAIPTTKIWIEYGAVEVRERSFF
jgi:hypothetical protein